MTKEKQIEEIAFKLWELMPISLELSATVATDLYNADYRKQSEVIDEFVKRLLDAFPEPHRGGNLCPAIYYDDYRYIIEELAEKMKGGADNE